MNQNYRHFLNIHQADGKEGNLTVKRTSLEKYPFHIAKPKENTQNKILSNQNAINDYLQTKKNMKLILKKTSYFNENGLDKLHFKTNRVELSNNSKYIKDNEKSDMETFETTLQNKSYLNNIDAKLTYNHKKENLGYNHNFIDKYQITNLNNTKKILKNENVNCFNASYIPITINPSNQIPDNVAKAPQNKVEVSIPKISNGLNLNRKNNSITNYKNDIEENKNMKFYSPPNYQKKRDSINKFGDLTSEDQLLFDVNESSSKTNTININITQNKLLLTKRESEHEIFEKNRNIDQQNNNSPYLLTENTFKKVEPKIKSNDFPLNSQNKINEDQRENNSRSTIQSFKEFSENFMKKTKNFFTFESGENLRNKCKCEPSLRDNISTCFRAMKWIQTYYKLNDLPNLKKDYDLMQNAQEDEACAAQIEKDLPRSFPNYSYFKKDSEGYNSLRRVLITFSKYDPQLGYVQGMNFIAGNLLYHSEEYICFWLLVMLFEIFELRDVFLPKLPGLSKHCQILEILILKNIPDFYRKMVENSITVNMFFSPWIFSLFGVLIPIETMADFFEALLSQKWPFVYKFVIVFLQSLKPKLIEEDTVGMLTFLTENNYKSGNLNAEQKINWKNYIKEANKISLENGFINKMLDNFDHDQQRFCIK